MWSIFKTKMFICLSKANLQAKILFAKITHQNRKTPVRGMYDNQNSTFYFDP